MGIFVAPKPPASTHVVCPRGGGNGGSLGFFIVYCTVTLYCTLYEVLCCKRSSGAGRNAFRSPNPQAQGPGRRRSPESQVGVPGSRPILQALRLSLGPRPRSKAPAPDDTPEALTPGPRPQGSGRPLSYRHPTTTVSRCLSRGQYYCTVRAVYPPPPLLLYCNELCPRYLLARVQTSGCTVLYLTKLCAVSPPRFPFPDLTSTIFASALYCSVSRLYVTPALPPVSPTFPLLPNPFPPYLTRVPPVSSFLCQLKISPATQPHLTSISAHGSPTMSIVLQYVALCCALLRDRALCAGTVLCCGVLNVLEDTPVLGFSESRAVLTDHKLKQRYCNATVLYCMCCILKLWRGAAATTAPSQRAAATTAISQAMFPASSQVGSESDGAWPGKRQAFE